MPTIRPLSGLYGSKFEQTLNTLCSPANIAKTASQFKAFEQSHGAYSFGDFAKHLMPNAADWGGQGAYNDWAKNVADIPANLRDRLTHVIRANLTADTPLPMRLHVVENVDQSHDLILRTFAAGNTNYIGILMLCPNPAAPGP